MTSAGEDLPSLPELRDTAGEVAALVVGPAFCDIVFSGLPRPPHVGEELWASACHVLPGGGYITAVALQRLGVRTAWATAFGTDPFSTLVREATLAESLDQRAVVEIPHDLVNLSASLSFGEDRSFVSHMGAPLGGVRPESAAASIEALRPQVVVLPGIPSLTGSPILDAARAVGARLVVDPQDNPLDLRSPELLGLLARVDVFAPNQRELCAITGHQDPDRALEVLLELTSFVLLKRGREGAVAARGPLRVAEPGIAVDVVETTGAGDCFNAGFVMAWLEGGSVRDCLRAGNAAGGLSTAAPGSAGIPRRDQVDALVSASRTAESPSALGSFGVRQGGL